MTWRRSPLTILQVGAVGESAEVAGEAEGDCVVDGERKGVRLGRFRRLMLPGPEKVEGALKVQPEPAAGPTAYCFCGVERTALGAGGRVSCAYAARWRRDGSGEDEAETFTGY